MSFSILKPDNVEWASCFNQLPTGQQDVFYAPSFARLCQSTLNKADEVLCAALVSDGSIVLYPFIKRNLARVTGVASLNGLYDLGGLYGRGGLVGTPKALEDLNAFHGAMVGYCEESSIVCGFDRFHPLLENHVRASPSASIMNVGGFVVVDLRPDMSKILAGLKHSVRKDLRKAERNGVKCFLEHDTRHLRDFLDIYYGTMSRSAAGGFYYFSEEYFVQLAKMLTDYFTFVYAEVGGDIVSCELVLHHGKYCHSFLGGTKQQALPLCANSLLKWEIIRCMKERGCEYFLLGGGTAENDGIFKYKRAFSPGGVLPSYVGGTIWDQKSYRNIRPQLQAEGVAVAEKRFQFYDLQ